MTDRVVASVVEAVATADGVDTADLASLHEYVDPDVLERLYEQDGGTWSFTFQYADHQVTVTHDERILVDGMAHTQDAQL